MKTTIGKFDPETRTVAVTFTEGAIKTTRQVNAAVTEDGSYDRAATLVIVAQQAAGVAEKIRLGIIG